MTAHSPWTSVPEDLVQEILIRFPLDDPSCLLRASLVSKAWSHAASGPAILRRLHDRAPRGTLHAGLPPQLEQSPSPPLRPRQRDALLLPCPRPPLMADPRLPPRMHPLHLRVRGRSPGYQRWLPAPSAYRVHSMNAAKLCVADGCDQCACHGGPFRVLFTCINEENQRSACVYSSLTSTWDDPTRILRCT
ncbi:uncharacterized protein [Aegilops tauschii subsp. strangulata]|uniref:uncharacterized protein n=1 Tax=Aegilops tauschii subsp. strangulata TaxID=200361 RepID=UPI003CC89B43